MYEFMQIGMIVVLVVVIVVLAILLVQSNNKEKFCGTCQGLSNKVGVDKKLLSKLYQDGDLTENSPRERLRGWPLLTWDSFQSYGDRPNMCRQHLN